MRRTGNWYWKSLSLLLVLCLLVSGFAASATELTDAETADYVLTENEALSAPEAGEEPGTSDGSEAPDLLAAPEAQPEAAGQTEAGAEEAAADEVPSDEAADEVFVDDLIIDEEVEAEAEAEPEVAAETEAEIGTEDNTESGAEAVEAETDVEAETETEAETESESESETEEPLLIEEEETGTEESTELEAGAYNLWIKGVQVSSENRNDPLGDGNFIFDGYKTLTIREDVNLNYSGILIDNKIDGLEIQVPKYVDAVLHSTGDNVIQSTGNLKITGRGSLELVTDSALDNKCSGILMNQGQLTIENMSMIVIGKSGFVGKTNTPTSLQISGARITVDATQYAITDFRDGIYLYDCSIVTPGADIDQGGRRIVNSSGQTIPDVTIDNVGYPIWVGSTQVTDKNKNDILNDGGKAKYDPATKTLTFNNPTSIPGTYTWDVQMGNYSDALIFACGTDLTIKGTLNVSTKAHNAICMEHGTLTLNGNLTLKLQKPDSNICPEAVRCDDDSTLVIQGGTIRLIGLDSDGDTEWYKTSFALRGFGNVKMNGGTLELQAGRNYTDAFAGTGGTIRVNGKYWLSEKGFLLKNMTFTQTTLGGTGFMLDGFGGFDIQNSTATFNGGYLHGRQGILIKGSKVSADTDGATVEAIYSNNGPVTITDSTVFARGAAGIKAKGAISIENSTVEALGFSSAGIMGSGSEKIEIKGDSCTVTAQGKSVGMVASQIAINSYHSITTPAGGKLGDAAGGQTVYSGDNVALNVVVTYKQADYSKVDAALKKIPSNLSQYTDASVKKVTDAKAAVKHGLPLGRQAEVNAMATAIENAIKGLTLKGADYSKVDAALKKIPSNLSQYTDASVKKVTDAKNAVKRGYNITQQKQVDAMATAIENAIKGLVKKPLKVKLVAAYNGAHGVGVKWVKLAGATQYTIWQKYKGVWRSIATVKPNDKSLQDGGSTLMYTDRTVKTGYGKGYIYSVSAKVGSVSVDYDKAGVAIYRLNPPSLKKVTNPSAGKLTITWKSVFGKTETNGAYDLQYATEANAKAGKFTSARKLPGYGYNVTSATITGLKKGTKYVFRIRCSKTNKDRGTFYSEYSPWLSFTVKK